MFASVIQVFNILLLLIGTFSSHREYCCLSALVFYSMEHLNLLTAAQYKLEVLEVRENEMQPDGGCQDIVLWSLTAMDEKNKKKERKKELKHSLLF